jgi:hypothetical protein
MLLSFFTKSNTKYSAMKKTCIGKLHYCILLVILFSASKLWGQGSLDTANWRYSNPKQFGFTVLDLDFYDNNNAIAVGQAGGIAYTKNGGTKWTYGAFTFINAAGMRVRPNSFQDVHFVTANVALCSGRPGLFG